MLLTNEIEITMFGQTEAGGLPLSVKPSVIWRFDQRHGPGLAFRG